VIGCAATTDTVDVPPFEPATAVIVTLAGEEGAVKFPLLSIVPEEAVHVELVAVSPRNAVNCTVWPTGTLAEPGRITSAPFTGLVPPELPPPQAFNVTRPAIMPATTTKSLMLFRIENLP
jgi:hypothetical protein